MLLLGHLISRLLPRGRLVAGRVGCLWVACVAHLDFGVHLAAAAAFPRAERCSGVIDANRDLPPFLARFLSPSGSGRRAAS